MMLLLYHVLLVLSKPAEERLWFLWLRSTLAAVSAALNALSRAAQFSPWLLAVARLHMLSSCALRAVFTPPVC
jgi:hypothetical protein